MGLSKEDHINRLFQGLKVIDLKIKYNKTEVSDLLYKVILLQFTQLSLIMLLPQFL